MFRSVLVAWVCTSWLLVACGGEKSVGSGGDLPVGEACDPAADRCAQGLVCYAATAGDEVCTTTCASNAACDAAESCFEVGFLRGGSESKRVCAASLQEGETCELGETYCDLGLDCVDGGGGPLCFRTCDPEGDWSECGVDACVPADYFAGTLDLALGICVPYLGNNAACDPYWDICGQLAGDDLVCADLNGDQAFTCTLGCDLAQGNADCAAPADACRPLAEVHLGLDPTVGVCVEELAQGGACDPDVDLCPDSFGCAGSLSVGFACRQHLSDGLGACVAGTPRESLPCDPFDSQSCGTGDAADCVIDCPDYNGGTFVVPQVEVEVENSDGELYCLRNDNCDLPFETGGTACAALGGGTCVIVAHDNGVGGVELIRTCTPVGAAALGDPCDDTQRCVADGMCLADVFGNGTCAELCDSSVGLWPDDCGAQVADAADGCDATHCCVDASCFGSGTPDGVAGVRLPDYGAGCDLAAQTGCGAGEMCLPQFGAWDRPECVGVAGTRAPGEGCDPDSSGAAGCAAGAICIPFFGAEYRCVEVCDPGDPAATCAQVYAKQANCLDVSTFDTMGPPPGAIGLCAPICADAGGCAAGQTCVLTFGPIGLCFDNCDAATDQGGASAECTLGEACIAGAPDSLQDFSRIVGGTGTCDATVRGGIDYCTVISASVDCPFSETCVESADVGPGLGFCASYAAAQLTCSVTTGSGCPTGDACYDNGVGDRFCAPYAGGAACDTVADCLGLGLSTPVCVPVAPSPGVATSGACGESCTYDAGSFPSASFAGIPCSSVAGRPQACYHVPGGAPTAGFCTWPDYVAGAAELHCQPNLPPGWPSGADQCLRKLGVPARCLGVANGAHEPTMRPEGLCITRCFMGARGDWGSCFGDPTACVADLDTSGLCLNFDAILDPPCDLVTQSGCAPFETCRPDFLALPPGGLMLVCDANIGTLPLGAVCSPDGSSIFERCAAGTFCAQTTAGSGECAVACDPVAPSCPTGTGCVDASLAYFGSLSHVGVCLRDDGCGLVAQDCSANEACAPVGVLGPKSSAGQVPQCVAAPGAVPLAQGCDPSQANGGCADDTWCAFGLYHPVSGDPLVYCTSFCDPATASGNPACNVGAFPGRLCRDVSTQFNATAGTYGVCTVN